MADELDLDLNDEEEKVNKVEKRIKDLSEKTKTAYTERDEAKAAAEKEAAEKAAALKDVDFYKNFSTVSSKYQGSAEYQDKIREKVNAGYDLEDATISILAKEGKYAPQAAVVDKESPAGGSAVNTIKTNTDKPLNEMSRDEMRQKLTEAQNRGDLGLV